MDLKLTQRFEKYENVLFLYNFLKKTIRWLCKNFYNEKLEIMFVFCEYNDRNEEEMKKMCGYHKLLIDFNEIMSNNSLSKEKKCEGFLNHYDFNK